MSPAPLPLEGRRILVTRAREQAGSLSEALRRRGAEVVESPAIRIEPPSDWAPVDAAIERLDAYDAVLFTSTNGVRFFCQRVRELGASLDRLRRVKIGAIGPATARALDREGLEVAVLPERFVAEAFFDALKAALPLRGHRFLLPRADIAREALPELLRHEGARVDVVVAYRTVTAAAEIARTLGAILRGEIDVVTFTSGSTVRSFFAAVEDDKEKIRGKFVPASIGPITSRALRDLGIEPGIEAWDYTTEGLAEAIAQHFRRHPSHSGASRR